MRISAQGNVIILLEASSIVFARGNDLPVRSWNDFSVADVRQIMESSSRGDKAALAGAAPLHLCEHDVSRRRVPAR